MTAPTKAAPQAAPPPERLITGKELAAMTELGRCELIEGRIVRLPYHTCRHGICVSNFNLHIRQFEAEHNPGKTLIGGVGIYTHHAPDTVRGMDVAFYSREHWVQSQAEEDYLSVGPDLLVEIIEPEDDRWTDVMRRLREFFAFGVRLVWVADPPSRTVYAYRSLTDVRTFGENDSLPGDDVLPGFSAPVASLFEE